MADANPVTQVERGGVKRVGGREVGNVERDGLDGGHDSSSVRLRLWVGQ
jgi:hypothetical protein